MKTLTHRDKQTDDWYSDAVILTQRTSYTLRQHISLCNTVKTITSWCAKGQVLTLTKAKSLFSLPLPFFLVFLFSSRAVSHPVTHITCWFFLMVFCKAATNHFFSYCWIYSDFFFLSLNWLIIQFIKWQAIVKIVSNSCPKCLVLSATPTVQKPKIFNYRSI